MKPLNVISSHKFSSFISIYSAVQCAWDWWCLFWKCWDFETALLCSAGVQFRDPVLSEVQLRLDHERRLRCGTEERESITSITQVTQLNFEKKKNQNTFKIHHCDAIVFWMIQSQKRRDSSQYEIHQTNQTLDRLFSAGFCFPSYAPLSSCHYHDSYQCSGWGEMAFRSTSWSRAAGASVSWAGGAAGKSSAPAGSLQLPSQHRHRLHETAMDPHALETRTQDRRHRGERTRRGDETNRSWDKMAVLIQETVSQSDGCCFLKNVQYVHTGDQTHDGIDVCVTNTRNYITNVNLLIKLQQNY